MRVADAPTKSETLPLCRLYDNSYSLQKWESLRPDLSSFITYHKKPCPERDLPTYAKDVWIPAKPAADATRWIEAEAHGLSEVSEGEPPGNGLVLRAAITRERIRARRMAAAAPLSDRPARGTGRARPVARPLRARALAA